MANCLGYADCPSGTRCYVARGYDSRCIEPLPLVIIAGETLRHSSSLLNQGSTGYPCQFNVDCGPGFACYKPAHAAIDGQCFEVKSTGQ